MLHAIAQFILKKLRIYGAYSPYIKGPLREDGSLDCPPSSTSAGRLPSSTATTTASGSDLAGLSAGFRRLVLLAQRLQSLSAELRFFSVIL
jgi:hypothetical protein